MADLKYSQYVTSIVVMQTVFFIVVAFGCAFARQPYVWDNSTCPENAKTQQSYIIDGEDAPDGKYPYMLSMSAEKGDRHTCGASILTKNWALTAAHCCAVLNYSKYHLKSGSNRLTTGAKVHKIDKFVMHEEYDPDRNWRNDICLIKVKDPFVFGSKVQQITLPTQNMTIKHGELVNVTGWGFTDPNVDDCPDKLQLGKNYVAMSREKCVEVTAQKHDSYLCVMGSVRGQGACNGDSGSPLVNRNGVQIGIASWVYMPCGCGYPDFYSRVPVFVNWIKKKLGADASQLKFVK